MSNPNFTLKVYRRISWPLIFISTFSELLLLGKINRPSCLAISFSFGLLHIQICLSDGGNIARSEIELKKTIFVHDKKKSALLLKILDNSLLLKSKFYEVFKEQSWPEAFCFRYGKTLGHTLRTTRFILWNNNRNTKQTKYRLHPAGTVL